VYQNYDSCHLYLYFNTGSYENYFYKKITSRDLSEFRGKVMVGIREFYEADGELKPGKKGEINFNSIAFNF
jgi:hypothetical protein